jgi:2'-hydroxyisoflavone reductase
LAFILISLLGLDSYRFLEQNLWRMKTSRRAFLACSATAFGAAACVPEVWSTSEEVPPSAAPSLKILILGGTGFLGPACTVSALARGHKVTQFTSGRTEELRHAAGRPSAVPDGVEQLYGNRDPNKTAADRKNEGKPDAPKDTNSPKGLSQLVGRKWDAVIDTSGFFPRMVKASAELLAPNVKQYVFISTISAYKDFSKPDFDETAPLAAMADPTSEEMGKDFANYGGGKALCEKAAEDAMPGRVTNLRPGFMVGPRDTSGRFLYWPARESLGGVMIVPGAPTDPIQIIDVRDVADFIIHCLEQNIVGVYNVTGPAKPLSMKGMVEAVRDGVTTAVDFVWIANDFLDAHGIQDGQFPLYNPPTGPSAGLHRCNISRALARGLTFRPLSVTAKDSLDWYHSLPAGTQAAVVPQLAQQPGHEPWLRTEKQLLEFWHQRARK